VKLLLGLLQAHGEWFRLQRCKDRFVGPLGIDALYSLQIPEAGATPIPWLCHLWSANHYPQLAGVLSASMCPHLVKAILALFRFIYC